MLAKRKVGANWPTMEGDLSLGCGNSASPTSQLQGPQVGEANRWWAAVIAGLVQSTQGARGNILRCTREVDGGRFCLPDACIAGEVAHNLSLHRHLQGQLQWGAARHQQQGGHVSLSWPASPLPPHTPNASWQAHQCNKQRPPGCKCLGFGSVP